MTVQDRRYERPGPRGGEAPTLDPAACRAILARNGIGRLAFTDQDRLHVHPVNYRVDHDGSVVFRSGRGAKLRAAEREPHPVSLEVEENDEDRGGLQVVLATGRIAPVLDLGSVHHLSDLGVEPWPEPRSRDRWIRLTIDRIEGWSLPPAV